MRNLLVYSTVAALAFGASQPARSAETIVPFTGLVLATCVLTVGTPGILGANADYSVLSSTGAGGVPGLVTVLSTGANFNVSAIAPSAFTISPEGGNDSVAFAANYQGAGATSIGNTPGATATRVNTGITALTVNLEAAKSSGPFPGGAYTAEVVVRCE